MASTERSVDAVCVSMQHLKVDGATNQVLSARLQDAIQQVEGDGAVTGHGAWPVNNEHVLRGDKAALMRSSIIGEQGSHIFFAPRATLQADEQEGHSADKVEHALRDEPLTVDIVKCAPFRSVKTWYDYLNEPDV